VVGGVRVPVLRTAGFGSALVAALAMSSAAWAGDGTFPTEAPGSPYAMGGPQNIAVGDFNNDGIADIASVTLQGPGGISVRLGAGDGSFPTVPTGSPFGTNYACEVSVADFNNDGNQDLATADCGPSENSVTIRFGDGAGGFSQNLGGSPLTTNVSDPRVVGVGDFNNDGREDIAICNYGSGNVTVFLASQFATFPTGTSSVVAVGANPQVLVVSDFNEDGNEDLAVGLRSTGDVSVRLGNGTGGFATSAPGSPIHVGDNPVGFLAGDLNADGHEDLAVVDNTAANLTALLGNGTGNFPESTSTNLGVNTHPQAVTLGDFNSDGLEDLAIGEGTGLVVRRGDGSGSYSAAGASQVTSSPATVPIAADFNGDGNVDLAVTRSGATVWLGGGTAPLAGNLLDNGGFEGAGAARVASQAPDIPGWGRSGGMTFIRYGATPPTSFPTIDESPGFLTGGINLLFGGDAAGSGGTATATQAVDVSGSTASVDAGLASAHLSAELGGATTIADNVQATATFLDASGAPLGSFSIGPVTAADRHNETVLLSRSESSVVPAGTRSIRVTLTATDADSAPPTYAFADNVKLTLDAPPPPPPGGGGGGDTTPPTIRFAGKKGEKLGHFVKVRLVADEACSADVAGALIVKSNGQAGQRQSRFALKGVKGSLAASVPTRFKLKISRKARAAAGLVAESKAKVSVVATDPSGNAATSQRGLRLR
jgi:hypothetical protein